ncbi:MAG: ATP-binding protein [Candidatus Thiodiazotropha taylori]
MGKDTKKTANVRIHTVTSRTCQLLILRCLFLLDGYKELALEHGISNDSIAYALGMGKWVDDPQNYTQEGFVLALRQRYKEAEVKPTLKFPKRLRKNVKYMSRIIGLNKLEQEVLMFLVLTMIDNGLKDTLNSMEQFTFGKMTRILATLLNQQEEEVVEVLSSRGKLIKAGLIKRSSIRGITFRFDSHLDFVTDDFASRMMIRNTDLKEIFKEVINPAKPAKLTLNHYSHIRQEADVLIPYLKHALKNRCVGVNILLEGPPGTGKSEFTRVVARELGVLLYDISTEDEDGKGMDGTARMHSYRVAQTILCAQESLIVFDECGDVFGNEHMLFGNGSSGDTQKGWINRALEDNKVISFWLTNSVGRMDPAYIRRFDIVITMAAPGEEQRKQIFNNICGAQYDTPFIERLAKSADLSPAVLERAVNVVNTLDIDQLRYSKESVVTGLINSTLKAQGHRRLDRLQHATLPENYRIAFTNADTDLEELVAGIAEHGRARLCLYGPPGTGKSAFGHWLGKQCGKKILAKKGADLLDAFVGGTETRIAAAFSEALEQDRLLLFDEVDTFVYSREGATRSWEVTAVNEFLLNTEVYNGLMVATTNRNEALDKATMRRFDLQVKFDYLSPGQVVALYETVARQLALVKAPATLLDEIARLKQLTPGDFQMLIRQSRFKPFSTPECFVKALQEINARKGRQANPIGFVHSM